MSEGTRAVDRALTRLLLGRGRPITVEQISAAYGDTQAAQRSAMAIELYDLPAGVDKRSRAYRSATRTIQRRTTEAGQRRRSGFTVDELAKLRAGAIRRLLGNKLTRARRYGLRMRIRCEVIVSKITEVRTFPADAGGRPRFQYLEPAEIAEPLEFWEEGLGDDAGELLLEVFMESYWSGGPAPSRVISCQLQLGGGR